MKALRLLFMMAVIMVLTNVSAFAEIMRGEVTAIDQQDRSITINQLDQSGVGVTRENLELNLRENTQYTGISSLKDLKVGDEVLIEANKRIFGPWEIKHLQSTKAGAAAMKDKAQKAKSQGLEMQQKQQVLKQESKPAATNVNPQAAARDQSPTSVQLPKTATQQQTGPIVGQQGATSATAGTSADLQR